MKKIVPKQYLWSVLAIAIALTLTCFPITETRSLSRSTTVEKPTAAACNVIQHAAGASCVPQASRRLVTLSLVTLADAIALGEKPIASNNFYPDLDSITYLSNEDKKFELLGRSKPNLEKLLLIKPDLIIGWSNTAKEIYPLLSKIAPTALGDFQGGPSWRSHFNFVARVLGKEKVGIEVWNHYYKRVNELKSALGKQYQSKEISFIYIGSRGIESDVKNSFAGSILHDVGLQRPQAQSIAAPYGIIRISEEELYKADGDILFITAWNEKHKQTLIQLQQKPIWKTLRAVQNNQVFFVNFPTWTGSNLLAANAILDDLEKYLVRQGE